MQKKKVVLPDYRHSNINVTSTLFHYYGKPCDYAEDPFIKQELKKGYTTIVYMVLDGFGTHIMQDNLEPDNFMSTKLVEEVSCVYPSSTVPSTTAIQTGKAPNESGWFGWQQHFDGKFKGDIEMFTGKEFYTKETVPGFHGYEQVPVKALQDILDPKKVKGITMMDFMLQRGGYLNFHQLMKHLLKAGKDSEPKYIYAYYQDPDHTMHGHGSRSAEAKKVCNKIDRNLSWLYRKMNDQMLVIITADHGQRDVKYDRINDYPKFLECLAQLPSWEGRAGAFTLKPKMKKQFESEFNKHFAKHYKLYSKAEVKKSHLLGLFKSHPDYDKFMGDYLIVSTDDYNMYYDTGKIDRFLIGHHGGMTIDEMRVPIIVLTKK